MARLQACLAPLYCTTCVSVLLQPRIKTALNVQTSNPHRVNNDAQGQQFLCRCLPWLNLCEDINVALLELSGMSAPSSAASWKLTPKNKFHLGQTASSVSTRPNWERSGLRLTLRHVIGTTTSSSNAFDTDTENNSFVCCAGPAAILSHVDDQCDISQRLFRARDDGSAVNSTPSFYNPSTPTSTPSKSRQASPLKDRSYGLGPSALYESAPESLAHSKANTRSREATCVALSPGGQLLAVGEVNKPSYSSIPIPIDISRQDITQESFFSLQAMILRPRSLCQSLLITALV